MSYLTSLTFVVLINYLSFVSLENLEGLDKESIYPHIYFFILDEGLKRPIMDANRTRSLKGIKLGKSLNFTQFFIS